MDVLTAGPVPPNASDLILSDRMKETVAELKASYDYVILDTPPILLISDALVLMEHVDTALLVTNVAKSSRRGVQHLEDLLEQNGLKHASFVLNGVRTKRWANYYNRYATKYGYATYGAEYGYGYGYGGSERYKDQDAKAHHLRHSHLGLCEQSTSRNPLAVKPVCTFEDFVRCVDAEAPAKTMTPQASPRHFLLSLVTLCAFALGSVSGLAQSPPNLTHVDNVNNAGNATLYWDVFEQQGTEEFVQNEIKVFDLDQNPLGTQWHIISSEFVNGNLVLPTGWVMPSFLYDANQLAHCYIGVQVTVDNGGVAVGLRRLAVFVLHPREH